MSGVGNRSSRRSGSRTREESKVGGNAGVGSGANSETIPKSCLIFALANPRSGDGLARGFLTDFPALNEK